MPRPKGSPNKVTAAVKEQLQNLIDSTINSIHLNDMSMSEKIKLLQISLQYVLPKLRYNENEDTSYQDEPIFIEVVERKKDEEEAENWQDNFEVTEVHKIDPVSRKVS